MAALTGVRRKMVVMVKSEEAKEEAPDPQEIKENLQSLLGVDIKLN